MSRFKIPTSKNTKSNNDDNEKVILDDLIDMLKVFPNNYDLGKKIRSKYLNFACNLRKNNNRTVLL